MFSYGYDIFTGKTKVYPKTIGEWGQGLPYSNEFKNHTIIPFLAGNLGVKTEEIKKLQPTKWLSSLPLEKV